MTSGMPFHSKKIIKVDFLIGWTGGHLEIDPSHNPDAELKLTP